MSDALPFPARPNLEHYKKLAKDLVEACKSGEPDAIRAWAAQWLEELVDLRLIVPTYDPRWADFCEHLTDKLEKSARSTLTNPARGRHCTLADAQLVIARGHGFASWPKFAKHLETLARADSLVSKFEAAVDAIVSGDPATLEKLLRENPELVRERSAREHRATLLHYVAANGVENFRQKTPKNVIEITTLLLKAGADVNAESEAYGGHSTTLGLTATSCHPEDAGVQLALMELLIDKGAMIDGPDRGNAVNACLHNGRGEAAEFLARRGARLDLEGAAGVGRLDVVRSFFRDDGSLKPPATAQQMKDGFGWACEFGRTSVVDFLLQRGIKVETKLKHNGQTGLHWAAYGGNLDAVKLLLQHGARIDRKDETYGGTPLDWALYAWANSREGKRAGRSYYEVVSLLVRQGAKLDPQWYGGDEEGRRAAARMRSDPHMLVALRGEYPAK